MRLRLLARVAGALALVASLYYVGRSIADVGAALPRHALDWRFATGVVLSTPLFVGATFVLVWAWHQLVLLTGEPRARWRTSWGIYGSTVLLKYVPGNVLHLAGRQAVGAARGYGHGALASSVLIEMVSLVVAASLIAAAALAASGGEIAGLDRGRLALVLAASVLALAAAPPLLGWLLARRAGATAAPLATRYRRLATVVAGHLGFFAVGGATSAALLWVAAGGSASPAWLGWTVAAHGTAWVAGFLAPGAPAGLGVREAVMIAVAMRAVPEPLALAVALGARAINVLADALFFAITAAFDRRAGRGERGR